MRKNSFKLSYLFAMFIYGTVPIFSHYIDIPSGLIILCRGIIGVCVLFFFAKVILKEKTNWKAIKNNILYLILAGASLGFNWICLFTSYNYTSVAVATVFNYLAPAIMILLAPIVFKEKITIKKVICVFVAFIGMFFVSEIFNSAVSLNVPGILLGLGSATGYVGIIIFNKKQKDISVYHTVIIQLMVASLVMLPYACLTTDFATLEFKPIYIILLLIIGLIHTGFAYILYYGAMPHLSSQTISIFSYVEPVTAILLSVLVLKEKMSLLIAIGIILILGATFVSEITFKGKERGC